MPTTAPSAANASTSSCGADAMGAPAAPALSACPACVAAPAAEALASRPPARGALVLSLPTAHCAVCISDVERALTQLPGVRSARVNLSQKRVTVDAAPD